MQRSLTIVHTSDVHLDSRDTDQATNGFRSRAERAFAGVVDTTGDVDADLLLIAGDLFDNNRVDDSNIDFVYAQFARLRCPVVMLPGNHDVHDEGSVWNRFDFDAAGDHVHGLMSHAGDCVTLDDIGARVWGKAMAEHAPENYPLSGAPARHDQHWNIGMAHGQVVERRVSQGSSPITREEIRTSGFDYLALGHIHVWADHSEGETAAFYSGSPVAHFAGANGGHVAVVNLCPANGVSVESRRVSSWERAMERSSGGFPF
ncbi:MAG: DNA repair exonuclease [Gammaproteobacteria bacterium]|nr:DNA repair exonuclease [Gammaproteobacteria bacterium]MDE0441167.1 DNA repair exonuclease [Gammaproteobacteria bacterium]